MDLGAMYPDKEDLQIAFDREFAVLRESLGNVEQLFKRILESKQFLDDKETAQLLHCSVNEIPMAIPRYRGSNPSPLHLILHLVHCFRFFVIDSSLPIGQFFFL